MKNGLLVVILRSLPQADDEESERDVKREAESGHGKFGGWKRLRVDYFLSF